MKVCPIIFFSWFLSTLNFKHGCKKAMKRTPYIILSCCCCCHSCVLVQQLHKCEMEFRIEVVFFPLGVWGQVGGKEGLLAIFLLSATSPSCEYFLLFILKACLSKLFVQIEEIYLSTYYSRRSQAQRSFSWLQWPWISNSDSQPFALSNCDTTYMESNHYISHFIFSTWLSSPIYCLINIARRLLAIFIKQWLRN